MKTIGNERGYAKLMEIFIAVIIIIILYMSFTPSFEGYVGRTRVRTSIRNLLLIKKALNNMAATCGGYPIRDNITSMNELLPIIDKTECKPSVTPEAVNPVIFPKENKCEVSTIGSELLPANKESTGVKYHSSTLCASSCRMDDSDCRANSGLNFWHMFITVTGQDCSPDYGSPSGPEFPGAYRPGWKYTLLKDDSARVNQPVAVLCGISAGVKVPVKIVINTGGFYFGTEVPEGAGMFDIDGNSLPVSNGTAGCPCGPYCQEIGGSNQKGCCSSCTDAAGKTHPGIGYRF